MLLAGDIKDGEAVTVSAGTDGLIIGDRVAPSNRAKPDSTTVH
jgi:ATP-dependent Clp protease ATP-binding subunit ClpB